MKIYHVVAAGLMLSAVPMMAQMTAAPMAQRGVAGQPISPVIKGGKMMITMSDGSSAVVSIHGLSHHSPTGLPTGKRMHKPFVITKEIDGTSPRLAEAMNRHEVFPAMVITAEGAETDTGKVGSGLGGGKVSMQDISILRIRQVSKTMEEVTLEYASAVVSGGGLGLEDKDKWNANR
jgi:type VI secretion system secreted protein Hcp